MAAVSLVVAGLFSAGASHSIVWVLTAMGAIAGPYMAYRHDAMVAAVLAGAAVCAAIGVLALACAFASSVRGGDAWFAALQSSIAEMGPLRAFLVIAGVQLSAIVALESIEQFTQLGHSLGPLAALGAPLAIALAIQSVFALGSLFSLFGIARAVVRPESRIGRGLSPIVHRGVSAPSAATLVRPRRASDTIVRLTPLALSSANRPPP